MTDTQTSPTAASPNSKKSRGLPVTIGAVLATAGTVVALAGGGILGAAGSDGKFETGKHDVSTGTSALVSGVADMTDVDEVADVMGHPKVGFHATAGDSGKDVFVGIGPAAEVDKYLAGTAVDEVTDIDVDPFVMTRNAKAGDVKATPPAKQSFWVAESSGQDAKLNWQVRDGDYRMVVMNADGSAGVSTDSRMSMEVPFISTIALVSLIAGIAALIAGAAMIAPSLSAPKGPGPIPVVNPA
jgi:hypothetical protein